ncbi:MAG: hypothetical protein RLP09_17005 [Sandaracinaceae bacterium]
MPLDLPVLTAELQAVAAEPPSTVAECAASWAAAAGDHALGVVPASSTVAVAASALEAALVTAFSAGAAAPGMETAFASFAVTIGGGMAGFVPTPPAGPVGFATQFAGPKPATHAAAAGAVAALIDTWMRTGTATPSGGGAPVSWS